MEHIDRKYRYIFTVEGEMSKITFYIIIVQVLRILALDLLPLQSNCSL